MSSLSIPSEHPGATRIGTRTRSGPAVAHHRGFQARPPRHPDSPDPSDLGAVRRWLSSRSRPTAIDLFCGAGGLSLGLEQAGFDVIVGAESDAWAIETHAANLPGLSWHGDLSDPTEFLETLDVWRIDSVDLVAAGVPCQPFSRAGRSKIEHMVATGRRSEHDERADLWQSFIAVVDRLQPRAVLVENVPDLPRWDDGAVLVGFYESLIELGYDVEARVLDGFRHGVPQHRQRLILIGLKDSTPRWPEPSDQVVDLRAAIGDLPIIPRAQRAEVLRYDRRRIASDFQREMRQDMDAIDAGDLVWEHVSRDVRPDDLQAFDLMSEGQTYADLPGHLQRYRADVFTDKYKRLAWNQLSRSITAHIAKDGYWYIHPDQHRTLTIREAARVQTFPDHFRFAGTPSYRYRQIGNAVPVRLGRAVGEAVLRALEDPLPPTVRQDRIRGDLISWANDQPSHHPWRDGDDAWSVLIGELCLRRGRPAEIPALHRSVLRAVKSPDAIVQDIQGARVRLAALGLKAATESLIQAAIAIKEDHDGVLPSDELALRSLPGVGDYVAQAVRCFAFERRAVLVDRTTTRVAGRLAARDRERRFQTRLDLFRFAGASGPDAAFNRALIALGETICRPTDPRCGECPLAFACASAPSRAATPQGSLLDDGIEPAPVTTKT
jgi:DNA (cytosine-5)-methyltransferase 1